MTLLCGKCHFEKKVCEFYKNSLRSSGYNAYCKKCLEQCKKQYQKSIGGVIALIYDSQIRSAQKRKHNSPTYSKKVLIEYALKDSSFMSIYQEWCDNGYSTDQKPSYDRICDDKSYTLSNISATTWIENKRKEYRKRKKVNNRPVPVIGTNSSGEQLRFASMHKASEYVGIANSADIRSAITRNGTAGGLTWRKA